MVDNNTRSLYGPKGVPPREGGEGKGDCAG